jgi:type II secretory pathway pseudopilin PulG
MSTARRFRSGFTLIEVLVAATVSVLVVGGALAVVTNALAWHERVDGRQQARAEASRVLDRVAADFVALAMGATGEVALAATVGDETDRSGLWENAVNGQPRGATVLDREEMAALRFGVGGVWLRFLAQVSDPGGESGALPRAVSYQIIRRRIPGAAGPGHVLHRSVVRSGETEGRPGMWEAGTNLDPSAGGALAATGTGNDGSVVGDPFSIVRPEAAGNVFAEGVVDFGVRFLETTPDGSWHASFPSGPAARESLAPKGEHLPQAADLMVRVLTPAGVRRLSAFEADAAAGGTWWGVVAANSEVMTRRVWLPGGGR